MATYKMHFTRRFPKGSKKPKLFGALKGKIVFAADYGQADQEILNLFEVRMNKPEYIDGHIQKYAGSIKNSETAWGKAGLDATEWLRRQRDEQWD